MKPSQQDQELFRAQRDIEVQSDTMAELSGKAGKAGYRNLPVMTELITFGSLFSSL
jgi:hypothetical protein